MACGAPPARLRRAPARLARRAAPRASHARAPLRRAQGVFCTVQPFWEVIEFVYKHAGELGEHGKTTLCLFKSGVLPDATCAPVSRGSRLHVDLAAAMLAGGESSQAMTVNDGATALLMYVASAASEHEEHLYGVEVRHARPTHARSPTRTRHPHAHRPSPRFATLRHPPPPRSPPFATLRRCTLRAPARRAAPSGLARRSRPTRSP